MAKRIHKLTDDELNLRGSWIGATRWPSGGAGSKTRGAWLPVMIVEVYEGLVSFYEAAPV